MSKLLVNGKLTVPLFDGTSTLFCDSIRLGGLGARNMVKELRLRIVARELLEFEGCLQNMPSWLLEKHFLLKLGKESAQVPTSRSLMSFRYGGTYVTPSRQTAVRYALLNQCGSEALAGITKVLDVLITQFPDLAHRKPFSTVLDFVHGPSTPVLIEACDVPETCLRPEQGGPNGPVLQEIEDALTEPEIYEIMVSQSNFELVRPIAPFHLRFYRILKPQSRNDSFEEVELVPLA